MTTTEQLNLMLTHITEAGEMIRLADETACQLNNTQAIDFHESSALSNHLYKSELAINELISYLQATLNQEGVTQ